MRAVTLTLAGTWVSAAAGYCQAKRLRTASSSVSSGSPSGSRTGQAGAGSVNSSASRLTVNRSASSFSLTGGWGSTSTSSWRQKLWAWGWAMAACITHSPRLAQCSSRYGSGAPEKMRRASFWASFRAFLVAMVMTSLSRARVKATYSTRISSLRPSWARADCTAR